MLLTCTKVSMGKRISEIMILLMDTVLSSLIFWLTPILFSGGKELVRI